MHIILALRYMNTQVIDTGYGQEEISGLRCILAVTRIVAKVQTTVMFGNDLYSVGQMSNLDQPTVFTRFLSGYYGRPIEWAQMPSIPPPPTRSPYLTQLQPVFPSAEGKITLLSSGYDPLYGFWVEFLGNYFLGFPIFQDWADLVIRDGPTHHGFLPQT